MRPYYAEPILIILALVIAAVICSLTGCTTSKLPPGSYLETRAGYTKADGASGKAIVHIPLD